MKKNVAVLVVNPVNGAGLFQYLEAFYENGISYKTFAVAETNSVKTNSGISFQTDDTVANLKNNADNFNSLVFACGDAMPKFAENAGKPFNQDMFAVIHQFVAKNKLVAGHCAAALLFDSCDELKGKKAAQHPFIKSLLKGCIGTDEAAMIDGNLFTARDENTLSKLIPQLIKALKDK